MISPCYRAPSPFANHWNEKRELPLNFNPPQKSELEAFCTGSIVKVENAPGVKMRTQENKLPSELWNHIGQAISTGPNLNLGEVSHLAQGESENTEYENFMQASHPFLLQITKGLVPVNELPKNVSIRDQDKPILKAALQNQWIRAHLLDKTLNVGQLIEAMQNPQKSHHVLLDKGVQSWLEQNPQYINRVTCFSLEARIALKDPLVRSCLNDKTLSFEQVEGLTTVTRKALMDGEAVQNQRKKQNSAPASPRVCPTGTAIEEGFTGTFLRNNQRLRKN